MNKKGIFLFAVILACISTASYYFYNQKNNLIVERKQSIPTIKYVLLKPYSIHDEIEALGTTYANEAVEITSPVTDKIKEIRFEDGQFVKKDDVLVILEQSEELAQKDAESSQVLEHERELKRLTDLLKRHATPETQYDERKTLLAISKFRLAEINARINDRTIRAPFDGVLGLRKISVGALVEPGTVITTLDDVSKIKLDFSIPALYLDVVKEGLNIKAFSAVFKEKTFSGQITKISSRVDPQTRSVEIRAILPNPKLVLKPGMLLSVKLIRNTRNALLIPEEAIIQLQDTHYILVLNEDNVVEKKLIEIGMRQPGWAEVLSGVNEKERVISQGTLRVKPGDSVKAEVIDFSPNGEMD